jgi:hypothetical protein
MLHTGNASESHDMIYLLDSSSGRKDAIPEETEVCVN